VRIEAGSLPDLACRYIERSGALDRRTRQRQEHLEILRQGKDEWNRWRSEERHVQPMLAGLARADVKESLDEYDFSYAKLTQAELMDVHLQRANFHQAILAKANLSGAHLEGANFCRTDLYETIMAGAHLNGANLQGVQLARPTSEGRTFVGARCTGYPPGISISRAPSRMG
jgi:uncharacterized protein YjbI with pentapeptide repeats